MTVLTLVTDTTAEPGDGGASYAAMASLILGIIMPLIVSAISNPKYSKTQRQLIALGASVVVGILNLIVQGVAFDWTWTVGGVVANLVLVIGAAQAAYAVFYHPSGVAKKVEQKTSKTPQGPRAAA